MMKYTQNRSVQPFSSSTVTASKDELVKLSEKLEHEMLALKREFDIAKKDHNDAKEILSSSWNEHASFQDSLNDKDIEKFTKLDDEIQNNLVPKQQMLRVKVNNLKRCLDDNMKLQNELKAEMKKIGIDDVK